MILPDYADLTTWASSLVIDFPTDNVPLLRDEEAWKEWGNDLVQTPTFSQNNAPSTDTYSDWRKWAHAIYYSMNDT